MRRGFTLIELLVVMAIISILASLMFPVFSRARGKAVETACLSNIYQINLAAIMYAQDNDGMMCPGDGPWGETLQPYIKNYDVLRCSLKPQYPAGFALNYWMSAHNISDVDYPVQVIIFADATVPAAWYLYPKTVADPDPDGNPDTVGSTLDFRHNNESANFSFCDGHCKRMTNLTPAAEDFLTTWDPVN